MNPTNKPLPEIDISECVLCDICVDLRPDIFIRNDSGYIEVSEELIKSLYDEEGNVIDTVLLDDIQEAIKNCRGDCVSWDETTETNHI